MTFLPTLSRETASELAPVLTARFNRSLKADTLPEGWLKAEGLGVTFDSKMCLDKQFTSIVKMLNMVYISIKYGKYNIYKKHKRVSSMNS